MFPDEGMWIPLLLNHNEADMKSRGMKITAEDIYSVNHSSLKDAIVKFGSGCTGEFISEQGLVLTNYHCAHGAIQSHSSIDHDYLTHGFWAANYSEELPCPDAKVTLLVKMEDVTKLVLQDITKEMTESEVDKLRSSNIANLTKQAAEESGMKVEIRSFFSGNQYYMLYNQVFEDVRLVGAPPIGIGKFGGETDNWVWPRHTGDFTLFRVYADADNNPAKYSANNKPYQPKTALKISLAGIKEQDFTFVFGYPARTNEYLTSYAIAQTTQIEAPILINARTKRLNIIGAAMQKDDKTRIQYSAKYASIANAWKKRQGEIRGIKKLNGIEEKQKFEAQFQEWAATYAGGVYNELLPSLKKAYDNLHPYVEQATYMNEQLMAPEMIRFIHSFDPLLTNVKSKQKTSEESFNTTLTRLKNSVPDFFKNLNVEVDKTIFKELSIIDGDSKNNSNGNKPVRLVDFPDKEFDKYVDEMYAKSIFTDQQRLMEALDNLTFKNVEKSKIAKDMLYNYVERVYQRYESIRTPQLKQQKAIDELQCTYMQAQMEMQHNKNFYPDANSTLRVTYGNVSGYNPSDAVFYKYYTTLDGLIAKEDPNNADYTVEKKLKTLYAKQDYGPYANAQGELPIAFVASNHTTGGNSGSPVLNAKGELIGINFDRTWEGTMSDLMYDVTQCRNISLDIRYCLFVIDKFAGAQHLIQEMNLVK
ncbi:Asp/Glu-specific dipeptidyl-peptidase [Bacteroidia bacterium]|nr:Asp/Glu-specific dipeptidyl-peptidase [Bacteroidia bacterium]